MKQVMIAFLFTLVAGAAQAQTVVPNPAPPTTLLGFNHDGVDTDGYWLYVDGVKGGSALVVTVTVAPARTAPFPALTRGVHTLEVTAFNVAGESPKSNTLSVRVVVIPVAPNTLHIEVVKDTPLLLGDPTLRDGE